MKIENPRTDIVSHKSFPKNELIRLVKKNNEILIDKDGTLPGRGIYIHKDEQTIRKSKKAIEHHLKVSVTEELISNLLNLL